MFAEYLIGHECWERYPRIEFYYSDDENEYSEDGEGLGHSSKSKEETTFPVNLKAKEDEGEKSVDKKSEYEKTGKEIR